MKGKTKKENVIQILSWIVLDRKCMMIIRFVCSVDWLNWLDLYFLLSCIFNKDKKNKENYDDYDHITTK